MESTKREQPYTVLDAFAPAPFGGNPAAVVVLIEELSDEAMHFIAREFNLPVTAFLIHLPDKAVGHGTMTFSLLWMTPTVELKLCGHATLATAKAIFASENKDITTLVFETRSSGILKAQKRDDGRVQLEFPAGETKPIPDPERKVLLGTMTAALGSHANVLHICAGHGGSYGDFLLVEFDSDVHLANLQVNIGVLVSLCLLSSYTE